MYTIEQINKAMDAYVEEQTNEIKKMDVSMLPKMVRKSAIVKQQNRLRAGMVALKLTIKTHLEQGRLATINEIWDAQEEAGFLVPNRPPKDINKAKSFREEKMSELKTDENTETKEV